MLRDGTLNYVILCVLLTPYRATNLKKISTSFTGQLVTVLTENRLIVVCSLCIIFFLRTKPLLRTQNMLRCCQRLQVDVPFLLDPHTLLLSSLTVSSSFVPNTRQSTLN